MMDGTLLNAKVYGGYAKAAARVGLPYDLYRSPIGVPSNPIILANKIVTLPGIFTIHSTNNFSFFKPGDFKNQEYHALIDATQINVGDYFVGPDGTFFLAAKTPAMPPLAVRCTNTVNILREASQLAAGNVGYLAHKRASEITLYSGMPASMPPPKVAANRIGDSRLPDDAPGPVQWDMYLAPTILAGGIKPRDIVVDEYSNRYMVSSAYRTQLGWKLQSIRLEA